MSTQPIKELISLLSDFSKKISDDLVSWNGTNLMTIIESLSPSLIEEFKQLELSNDANTQIQMIIPELKTVYSQFLLTSYQDTETYKTVHQQLSLIIQRIVGILDDNIALIDGSLSELKPVSIQQKIVDLTLLELETL
ncbi:hypothetical protein CL6EHI_c00083 [Entamoeba histolytica]|uniref:Uncharacterized protein n=2 Tax=Entamoeba histolytica TaxID=5759 RepID=A0A175JKV9_ENTHI|nr:Hypothetical protein EHI5A_038530 [Entamoeba histolytica KU27]GAT94340.1 hypothetical protein CL6EHI_c00083 [Entamoeba histolytica]